MCYYIRPWCRNPHWLPLVPSKTPSDPASSGGRFASVAHHCPPPTDRHLQRPCPWSLRSSHRRCMFEDVYCRPRVGDHPYLLFGRNLWKYYEHYWTLLGPASSPSVIH